MSERAGGEDEISGFPNGIMPDGLLSRGLQAFQVEGIKQMQARIVELEAENAESRRQLGNYDIAYRQSCDARAAAETRQEQTHLFLYPSGAYPKDKDGG